MAYRPLSSRLCDQSRPFLLALAPLVLVLWGASNPAPAQAQDLYAVDNIVVDETAASEVQAKDNGITRAKQDAFAQLVNRLTEIGMAGDGAAASESAVIEQAAPAPAAPPSFPDGATVTPAPQPITMPDPERLEFLIRDVSISNERFGGGRYLADVSVRFQPAEVNRFLQRSQAAYLSAPSPRAVILPLFQDANGGSMLWDETNPWLDAWLRTDGRRVVVPYVVPLGDLSDIAAIDAERLIAIDAAAINAIAARHNAGAVVIPQATIDVEGTVTVQLTTYGTGWPPEAQLLTLPAQGLIPIATTLYEEDPSVDPTTVGPLLHAAASQLGDVLDNRWKSANLLRFDEEAAQMVARAPLSGLSDWLSVRNTLDSIAAITDWTLAELNTGYALVSISYVGDEVRLGQAFARQNLALSLDPEARPDDLDAPRILLRR